MGVGVTARGKEGKLWEIGTAEAIAEKEIHSNGEPLRRASVSSGIPGEGDVPQSLSCYA